MNRLRTAFGPALSVLTLASGAGAEFGNLTYTDAEVFKPLVTLNDDVMISTVEGGKQSAKGSNSVMVLGGNFVIMGSADSGEPPGILHFVDVSDPRAPKRLSATGDKDLREVHALPTAHVNGKYIAVLASTKGIQTWDLSDPMGGPKKLGSIELNGVGGGDYDNTVWQTTMAWPYAYVGATGAGVIVVDISDPSSPQKTHQIKTGETGIGKVGPVHMAGNLLVGTSMSGEMKVVVVDVSDLGNPVVLGTGKGPKGKRMYSSLLIGNSIYFPGDEGNFHVAKWNATSTNATIDFISEASYGQDKGGYCSYQDKFVFCGQSSDGFFKIDVSDEMSPKSVGGGKFEGGKPDMDFATVLGNLVFLANDHTPGPQGAFIPHQAAPDTTPPEALTMFPAPASAKQPARTVFTVFFSDDIDLATVSEQNFIVYAVGSNTRVAGVYQRSSLNAITFSPNAPLAENTTYGVILRAQGGLTDVAGNPVATDMELGRIATGDAVDVASPGLPAEAATPVGAGGAEATTTGGAQAKGGTGHLPSAVGENTPPGTSGGSGGLDRPLDAPPALENPPPLTGPIAVPTVAGVSPALGETAAPRNSSGGCALRAAQGKPAPFAWFVVLAGLLAILARRRAPR